MGSGEAAIEGEVTVEESPDLRPGCILPTIRHMVEESKIPERVNCVYEVFVNGLDLASVEKAMKAGRGFYNSSRHKEDFC